MKTLYISDLDGTLLQPNVELSDNTVKILKQFINQNHLFSIATARTIATVASILKEVPINTPIILMNGVCIYDYIKKDYVNVEYFSEKSKHVLLDIFDKYQLKGFAYAINNGILTTYYENLNTKPLYDFYEERVTKYKKTFTQVTNFNILSNHPLIYFALMDQKNYLEPIYNMIKMLPDINCTFYKDNYSLDTWYLEIFSDKASKFHAVSFLRSYLNLDRIICFGDNHNDIPMFEASDIKLAVENAVDELKCKANAIIPSNINDGVAYWLKENVIDFTK